MENQAKERLMEIKSEIDAVESRTREVLEAHPGILGRFHPERMTNAVSGGVIMGKLTLEAFMEQGSPEGRQAFIEVFSPPRDKS
jgi:hypothetical protein